MRLIPYLAASRAGFAHMFARTTLLTHLHTAQVAEQAWALAQTVGCSPDEMRIVAMVSGLHDIGKIAIWPLLQECDGQMIQRDSIDWQIIQSHADLGAGWFEALIPSLPAEEADDLQWAANVVRHHHEHFDGSGYPGGLAGIAIPRLSRLLAVPDAFDAMTGLRRYRPPLSIVQALDEIRRCTGTQFDPAYSTPFIEMMERNHV